MITFTVVTTKKDMLVDITQDVQRAINECRSTNGIAHIFVPHTTAAITINENADPDVVSDMLKGFDAMVPHLAYSHAEGNSVAHIKSSMIGVSLCVSVENNRLMLGTWQGIYFCEFDGPRQRAVWVTMVELGGER